MSAGELRDHVTLEARVQTPTGTSGMSVTWVEVDHVWVGIRSVKEAEFAESVQVEDAATHTLRLRWRRRDDFDHISQEGRRWKVLGFREMDNRRRYMDAICRELTPEPAF